ncbi:alpha/beta fold hydrolase [Paracoccus nototheniae]
MATILLIHGAWHGGWCWDALAEALQARGHRVLCPDLPDAPGTGLMDAAATLPHAPVILGHSMGGMLAEVMAQSRPPRLLIHLCSYLPLPGDSLAALDRLLPAPARHWPRDVQGRLILPPEAAQNLFYHDVPAPNAAAALTRLRPQPPGPLRDPLPSLRRAPVRRHYILCGTDRALPIALQRAMLARAPVEHWHETPWGHSPFLSDPQGLAAVLDRIIGTENPS